MQGNKNISPYKLQLKDRILDTAMQAFAAHGLKAVKMDDIAQQLGISKRTLYEIYTNKEDLLFEGVKKYRSVREKELTRLLEANSNVMDVILHAYRMKVEEFQKTSPQFYEDLVKYPRVLEHLENDRNKNHLLFLKFLHRGIDEGYFRDDVDYELVSMIFNAIGQYVIQNQLYRKYSMEELFKNLIFVSLRGFCTSKGIKTIDQILAL